MHTILARIKRKTKTDSPKPTATSTAAPTDNGFVAKIVAAFKRAGMQITPKQVIIKTRGGKLRIEVASPQPFASLDSLHVLRGCLMSSLSSAHKIALSACSVHGHICIKYSFSVPIKQQRGLK